MLRRDLSPSVQAGGTKVACAIADADGAVIARGKVGPGNMAEVSVFDQLLLSWLILIPRLCHVKLGLELSFQRYVRARRS